MKVTSETEPTAAPDPALVRAGLARARAIARSHASPLVRAARRLRCPERRALFDCTYAAMRIIDDVVDAAPRLPRRAVAAHVDRWLTQAVAAMRGRFRPGPDSYEPALFAALDRYGGSSTIGPTPWRKLASALRTDVAGRKLATWRDFMTYAEGASVAPAGIFIYVIGCEVEGGARTRLRLPRPPVVYARDLALFCYLVHMLRDLAPDVRAGVATLPADLLRQTRLDRGRLARAVRTHDAQALLPLASALLAKAARFRRRAGAALGPLEPRLAADAKAALAGVRARYEATYAVLAADYGAYLESTGWGDATAAPTRPE